MKRLSRPKEGEALVFTASHLLNGHIVWLHAHERWCASIYEARRFTYEEAEKVLPLLQKRAQDDGVVGIYEVVVKANEAIEPVTMKERIRAYGPSIHPEFAYSSSDISDKEVGQ